MGGEGDRGWKMGERSRAKQEGRKGHGRGMSGASVGYAVVFATRSHFHSDIAIVKFARIVIETARRSPSSLTTICPISCLLRARTSLMVSGAGGIHGRRRVWWKVALG